MNLSDKTFFAVLKKNSFTFILYFLVLLFSLWTNYSIYMTVVFSFYVVFKNWTFKYADITSLCILSFSIIYSFIYMPNVNSWTIFISYLLCPTTFYLFGKYIIGKLCNTNNIIIFWSLSIFTFSLVLYISALVDISQKGIINITRSFIIWGVQNDASTSATLYGMIASLGLMGFPYFFVKQDSNIVRYIYLLLSLLSLITVIHLINRTGLVIFVGCFVVMSFYIFRNKIPTLIFTYVIIVILFILLIHVSIIDQTVVEAYQNRDVGNGSIDSVGGRTDLWYLALNNIFKYPFGWLNIEGASYSHNLWFDIARVSGILPFTIFLIISIRTYRKLFNLLMVKKENVVSLFLGLHICFFLTLFVEPVLEAIPLYFYLYMMLWGMQNRLLIQLRLKSHFSMRGDSVNFRE